MIYHFSIILLGFIASFILFNRFPRLKSGCRENNHRKVSIIIPARNEETNLQLLLEDLSHQSLQIHEIICVDDGSTDRTGAIATEQGAKLIKITEKPSDWTGKAWACQKGGEVATGELLLFLDADVRMKKNTVSELLYTYESNPCVISVQPYHKTWKFHEQFSLFFNLIQIAGNGTSVAYPSKSIGLYGPVILIHRETYAAIDGHHAAKESVVDDVVLGEKLSSINLPFELYLGDPRLSFRMYGDRFKDLFQGWVKNYSTGAVKTPGSVILLVTFWIASMITTILFNIWQWTTDPFSALAYVGVLLYFGWSAELFRVGTKIGRFKRMTWLFYPLYLLFFIVIFSLSMFKRNNRKHVVWKGRKIKLD